jgi:hypothetical protein
MKPHSHTFGGKYTNMKLKLLHTKLGSNNISIVELYQKPMTYKKTLNKHDHQVIGFPCLGMLNPYSIGRWGL